MRNITPFPLWNLLICNGGVFFCFCFLKKRVIDLKFSSDLLNRWKLEAYSELSQTSKMELFAKIASRFT